MPSSARVGMTDPTPGQPDGGAFRGGARGAGVPITTALRGEGRVLVCPPRRPCVPAGRPCVSWAVLVCPGPGHTGSGSATATAGRDDLDNRVRRQQQGVEQDVCRRDTKRPRHLEGVQVLSHQSAPGGIRTPNLLIRNERGRIPLRISVSRPVLPEHARRQWCSPPADRLDRPAGRLVRQRQVGRPVGSVADDLRKSTGTVHPLGGRLGIPRPRAVAAGRRPGVADRRRGIALGGQGQGDLQGGPVLRVGVDQFQLRQGTTPQQQDPER
jgi:hypothetical protein